MVSYISDTIDIVKIPCHTQAVERHIKIVIYCENTSTSVCGNKARDGVIRAKLNISVRHTKVCN